MTIEGATAIVACAITIVSVVAGAVWIVGQIKSETGHLRANIDHLSATVDGLKMWISEVAARQNHHGERIARVEARLDVCDEEE